VTAAKLSVVVASVNGLPYLGQCLEALAERCPDAEVIVADATDDETRAYVRERWPSTQLLSSDEPRTIPELRAEGIAAASTPFVALIEDHCVVGERWATRIVEHHEARRHVVGGAIRNAATRRVRDWAAFLCEYSEHMEPVARGPVDALPGMNVSYDRAALESIAELLAQGRWETWLHAHLRRVGFELYAEPELTIDHDKDFGFREFVSQRYHYARSYAGMRNPELGRKRVVYAVGSPLLVPLVYARIARNVVRRRRHGGALLAATPLILCYLTVWAAGEAVGYTLGGGQSLQRVR
jgi:hypothetical protein